MSLDRENRIFRMGEMTSPEIRDAIASGKTTLVVPFGAQEQHGPHLPTETDNIFAKEFGLRIVKLLGDALLGPTIPIGYSWHHREFPGTFSLQPSTIQAIAQDIISSAANFGIRKVALMPTHGGNFGPLGEAVGSMELPSGLSVVTFPNPRVLIGLFQDISQEHGISLAESGIHAGELETSIYWALRPQAVLRDMLEPGFMGDPREAAGIFLSQGVHALSVNGVIGDPTRASVEVGEKYARRIVDYFTKCIDPNNQEVGSYLDEFILKNPPLIKP